MDDGSVDGSPEIARRFAAEDPGRVRRLEHAGHRHRGVSVSRNLGLGHSRGEYVTFLDSDDVFLPGKLEQQVAIFEAHPAASLIYGNTRYWYSWTGTPEDQSRDLIPELGVALDTLIEPPVLLELLYPLGTTPAPSLNTVMVRRAVAQRLGGFEEAFALAYSDQSFLVKAYLREPVFVSSRCWDKYRQHPGSSSALVERTGQYHPIRRAFLGWLRGYLASEGVTDPKVLAALRRALAAYGE